MDNFKSLLVDQDMLILILVTLFVGVIGVLIILYLNRFYNPMAAFCAWAIQLLTNTVGIKDVTEASATNSSQRKFTQSKKSKKTTKKYTKSSELPVFNTKLSTPIAAIVEEAVNEEVSASETTSTVKDLGKKRLNNTKKSKKKSNNSVVKLSSNDERLTEEDSDSFVTVVKDKRNKKITNNTNTTTSSNPKVKQTNTNDKLLVITNKTCVKYPVQLDAKESKKVAPSLSYANAVTNVQSSDVRDNHCKDIIDPEEFNTQFYSDNIEDIIEKSTEQLTKLYEELQSIVKVSDSEETSESYHQETDEISSNIDSEETVEQNNSDPEEVLHSKIKFNELKQSSEDIKRFISAECESTVSTNFEIDENCDLKVDTTNKFQQLFDNQVTETKFNGINSQEIIVKENGKLHDEEELIVVADFESLNNKYNGDLLLELESDSSDSYRRHKRDLTSEPAMSQIRILSLNDRDHQESTIYRLEKNWIIQFRLGPSLFGHKVFLYCNYPRQVNGRLEEFKRSKYQLLTWCQDEGCKNSDDTSVFAQIEAQLAGSFHYYFVYDIESDDRKGSGYFIIDPVLKYGKNEELPLDCIQCQTVLAKSLGAFSTWENKLNVAKESGYNMIHFTPIQELGASNSSYSLSEQLELNPVFENAKGHMPSFNDIEAFIRNLRQESKVASICDIVLNHTANESKWLKSHPEVTYNCVNCPYMRPAYLLDAAFHCFSNDVKNGIYEDRGIPPEVTTEEHLNAIRYHFKLSVLEPLKLYELFTVDVEKVTADFLVLARQTAPSSDGNGLGLKPLELIQDSKFRRLQSQVDIALALKLYNVYRNDCFDEESRLKRCAEDLKLAIEKLQKRVIDDVNADLHAALENVIAGIKYFRVQADGPKFTEISVAKPLVYRYFTDFNTPKSLKEYEEIMYGPNGAYLMAHNGWVMNSDPLKNFADSRSKIYLRRELIAWGDSVKLRYGDSPSDCPFLWEHMRKYVELTAKIFDGVRLDNCHSTPLNVAEYLLDCARCVKPDLYVVAELFTNSDHTDNIFVNRLGITSLIREAMSAWDSHEEGRLVYRYGGVPVGSFYQPNIRPLVPSVAHALFLDLTHDNPSPVEKRSVFDMLPSSALVNMACCASGSNRGYDELVPHHIHVVDETRQYTEWTDDLDLAKDNCRYVGKQSGIIAVKRAINELHYKLGKGGFNQVYVDQMDVNVVAVTRHNPITHESYVLVAHTAFSHPPSDNQTYIRPLRVEGVLDEVVYEASLRHVDPNSPFGKYDKFSQDSAWINGLAEYKVNLKEHIHISESDVFEMANSNSSNVIQLNFKNFKPGSAAVIKVSLPEKMCEAVNKIRNLMKEFSLTKSTELRQIVEVMRLSDLNRALYRCSQEERDEGYGCDVYNIPNFGTMVYAGLQGMMSLLSNIRPNNDLGHPMCANLRDGNWMIEFIWNRLKLDESTKQLGQWFEENTKCFRFLPRYLVPCYFDVVVTGTYLQLIEQSYRLMSSFVANGSTFVKALSLGSVQFGAYIKSADLPILSPNLLPPKPPMHKLQNGDVKQTCVTLSAGLPHFSVGYMRNWGRDTFIALRGLFIITGRYQETREHILGYAACLRHGLIPNLLDGGRNSRFNCRDAIWWWLYCIKEYVQESPHGAAILRDKVSRLFPTDDSPPQPPGSVDQPLHDVIQEALTVHFQGIVFRERNAGKQIDEHMTERGFNNQIGVHPETGFVFGGNEWNCGTWMDKMGSSDKAGIRGKPATPRDGSAIELIGLSKCVISWLHRMHQDKKYPYAGVQRTHKNGAVTNWTFKEWSDKIQANFEKCFWIPSANEARADLVNKRGIYKDCYGSAQPWTDYQLRCNFPIAMVVAPELFNPQHACLALKIAETQLLGPLGMKTLDPDDWNFRGDYDNSNDSDDPAVAHGFNYHQGPEWLWPVGFFLRAKLLFAARNGTLKETVATTKVTLSKHFVELQTSPWRGLPELTNSNGTYCRDSSRTQAWSMSCILEVLHELQKIESMQIEIN